MIAICPSLNTSLHVQSHTLCGQDEVARLSAAHAEALRHREQEVAATSTAAMAEADARAAAAVKAADTALSELGSAREECQALKTALEQVLYRSLLPTHCKDQRQLGCSSSISGLPSALSPAAMYFGAWSPWPNGCACDAMLHTTRP